MPTKHPRINITMEPSIVTLLVQLAEQEHTSVANITKELVIEALERREDMALSAIAKVRDTKQAKKVKHTDAWK